MTESTKRYALYFAPPQDNPWWTRLSSWLGYDAFNGQDGQQPGIPTVSATDQQVITQHPRHYGAHATLKAPFRLSPTYAEQNLLNAVDIYAAGQTAFTLPALRVELLQHFIALVPSHADVRINRIADDCTTKFDHFRAPLSDDEMARRLGEPLDQLSRELLSKWGYPHVLQRYQFHISLTGSLNTFSQPVTTAVMQAAQEFFAPLNDIALPFNAVCVFRQDSAAQRFTLIHRAGMDS